MKKTKDRAPEMFLPYILRILILSFKRVSRETGFLIDGKDSITRNLFHGGVEYLRDKDDIFGNGKNLYPIVYPFFWMWIQFAGVMMIILFIVFKCLFLPIFAIQFVATMFFAIVLTLSCVCQMFGRLFIKKN